MAAGITVPADEELWSAIADPSRRQVLDLLVSHGAVSASWLAGRVPFTRQAVSKHLVVLERAGLISRRKQGREVLYQVEASASTRPPGPWPSSPPSGTSDSARSSGSPKPRTRRTRRTLMNREPRG